MADHVSTDGDMSTQRSLKDLLVSKPLPETVTEGSSNDLDDNSAALSDPEPELSLSSSVEEGSDGSDVNDPGASAAAASTEIESGIITLPNQPRIRKFPPKKFGKQQRSFNSKWFDNDKWSPWLHWDDGVQKHFVMCVRTSPICIN